MLPTDINTLTLSELCELLVTNTVELLDLLNRKGADGYLLRDKKKEVEMIQAAILKRRSEPSRLLPLTLS
jgi:hypothetical protein